MTERFEIQYDGYRYFVVVDIENERGIARMDTMSDAEGFLEMYEMLNDDIEQLKEHQKTLEAKIVRLKDRVKTFEKHYSLKDIERYKKMENCNCITTKRLEE